MLKKRSMHTAIVITAVLALISLFWAIPEKKVVEVRDLTEIDDLINKILSNNDPLLEEAD